MNRFSRIRLQHQVREAYFKRLESNPDPEQAAHDALDDVQTAYAVDDKSKLDWVTALPEIWQFVTKLIVLVPKKPA